MMTAGAGASAAAEPWAVQLRAGGKEWTENWTPGRTAIIVVDMWDDHHCESAARRVEEMAPAMSRTLEAAREKGAFVIHAPSDCMDWYEDTPQRKRARAAPSAKAPAKFQWNHFNPEREGELEAKLEKGGCSCDTPEPCNPSFRAWKRQNKAIAIEKEDAISDKGQEVYNLLISRGIEKVIVMGVHTNVCVLGRPFGIRQMVYNKRDVVLCRDLTDSYHRDPGRHFEGLERIIRHIEKNWCPTITSESITGKERFRFQGDLLDSGAQP
jgi:nicotinamidase-related amidase